MILPPVDSVWLLASNNGVRIMISRENKVDINYFHRQGLSFREIARKTGTSKSTLLLNMLVSDIRRGEGLALIDPHGDLSEQLLDFVPKARMEDVIFFNPADLNYHIAFNPLEQVSPEPGYLVVSNLLSIFHKAWSNYWGPRLEHILRYSLLTLLEYPGSILLDLPLLLTNQNYRLIVIKRVEDPMVREFWEFWEFQAGSYISQGKMDAVTPILNKIGQLTTSTPLRNILESKSALSLRRVIDEGKLLIVNLSKGKIGEDSSAIIGAMLVSMTMLSAMARADTPEERRRPFYLYVDEFHNFITPAFAEMLSESRKYGLGLILAHQYIGQLDEKVRSAIFGNAGTIISFRAGSEDTPLLAREFHQVFGIGDLIALANQSIYIKLMIDGRTSRPFSAITLPPPTAKNSLKRDIIELARMKWWRCREELASESLQRKLYP